MLNMPHSGQIKLLDNLDSKFLGSFLLYPWKPFSKLSSPYCKICKLTTKWANWLLMFNYDFKDVNETRPTKGSNCLKLHIVLNKNFAQDFIETVIQLK